MFAVALWDARTPAARARARPLRHQAALLPRRGRRARVRVRAARAAARRDRPRRARGVPRRSTRSRRRTRSSATRASFRPDTCSSGRRAAASTIERYARPGPVPVDELRGDDEAELVEELRARLRDSVRAHLLADVPVGVLLSGGVDSAVLAALAAQETSEARAHVHDRLRGAELRRARRRPSRRRALRDEPSRAARASRPARARCPRSPTAFDEPFADSSALPTYLVSQLAAEHVKVALSGEGGDELFGGYYTYAADLLADRVAPLARLARPLVERLPSSTCEGELRLQGEALRPRRAPAAARAASRLEGDLLAGRARRAARLAQRLRSGRRLSRAVRGDRGGRPARAPAGRRLRHLPRRRPAREDRPRVDGALARGARAVSRLRRDELRLRRCRRSTRCAGSRRRSCCARPPRRCCRARSCTGASVASRFPRPPGCAASSSRSHARRSRRTTLRSQGFFQPEPVTTPARRARRRRGGLEPPALGPAHVHALVRAPRRAGAAAAALRPDGGAARDESVDRHDRERARARVPAADRDHARSAATRCRSRRASTRRRLQLLELHGLEAEVIGQARRPLARAEGAADDAPPRRVAPLREGARLRRRARARLARVDDHGAAPRHPELDDVRLRVRDASAPARLPRGDEGRRAGRDPARAAAASTA